MTKAEKEFHKSRRKEFSKLIGKDSIALIFGSTHQTKSNDADFKFKQYKNFYYLTGFNEPNSALLIAPSGIKIKIGEKEKRVREVLFVQKKNPVLETWTGKRLGYENVQKELGIECGRENIELKTVLGSNSIFKFRRDYINFAEMMMLKGEMREIVNSFFNSLNIVAAEEELIDASFILGKMRTVKTQFEINQIQKACDITIKSYNETMKIIKPGLNESQVQATLEYHYKYNGSEENAYPPIVAGGENACILHYENNDQIIKDGELILIDSGSEYNYYASDITRTFPVNGKFSKEQKIIYEIVLKANEECIKKIKPGVKFSDLKILSEKVLADGLFKAGLLKNKKDIKKYSLHGVGHHIGLDTHDAVPGAKTSTEDNDTLKPGSVITIEPGLYFTREMKEIPEGFRGMGVRIEDDILVTKNGCTNLTKMMVKRVSEIEKVMGI